MRAAIPTSTQDQAAQTDRSVVFSRTPGVARCWVRPARDGVPRPWAHGHVAAAFESPPDKRGGGPSMSSGRRTAPALAVRGGAVTVVMEVGRRHRLQARSSLGRLMDRLTRDAGLRKPPNG